jgi:hypothetical protein
VSLTSGSIERIKAAVGWQSAVPLFDGVRFQLDWHRSRRLADGVD